MTNNFSFRLVEKCDYDLIYEWLHKEHVKPYFFGQGLQNTLNNLKLFVQGINHNGRYEFAHWLANIDSKPFAFLMTSPVTVNDHWYNQDSSTIMLDLLIGEEAYLGKGLAAEMIKAFIDSLPNTINRILIDPAEENTRAVHVYEKAGFNKIAEFKPDYHPVPHWMMELNR